MADEIQSNIKVNIDTTAALASIRTLQAQISAFHTQMSKGGAQASAEAKNLQQNLINSINATNKFSASMTTVKSSAEQFTTALEKNKLSLGEYFRYAGASSKSFGKYFKTEFETINKVARERVKDLQSQYIKLGRDANGALRAIKVRPLMLDMENLSTKTQLAAQKQQLLNQLLKQGSTNLLNFGKNTQWAGRQLMVGFSVPLAMAGSAAAKTFMQMEEAAIKFKRVYGDMFTTKADTNKALADVKKLAEEYTKYGLAVKDTMDMAATAAATGATGAKLLAQVNQANKLAALGGIDQQKGLETTISLTNAFSISADELSKKIDFLNAVENQTVTSIDDITTAIPKAAPVIKQLGGSVEDLTFFLTAMKEGGVNASEGANALKSGLAALINPTNTAKKMLSGFGIDISGIVEKDKGNLKKTVLDFASALDTLDPLNRARAIEQMFGKFQFSRLSTLFKNVADQNSQASRVMDLATRTPQQLAFISQKELEQMQNSTMYKFQETVQKLQTALVPIGEQFLKVVTPVIDGVTKILNAFNGLPDSVKNFATILVAGVAGIGPVLLMTFGLLANGVANLIKMFANLKDFFNKTGKSSLDLGSQTKYMTTQQIEAAAVGASLEQVHQKLQQRFTAEASSVDALTAAYERSIAAQRAFQGPIASGSGVKRKGYATGGIVRGPGTGTSDSIPAMLSAGEAVIPAKQAAKYSGLIHGMISGNLPGYARGGFVMQPRMWQREIGPQTQAAALASEKKALALESMHQEVLSSQYANMTPMKLPKQLVPSSGNSFITPRIGGIYKLESGEQVFIKPQPNLTSALAEMRGTQIARDAHGLVAPQQTLRVVLDPTDPNGKRTLFALESPLNDKIANPSSNFTKKEYFKQLVASLLRGDKDLGPGNLGGNVLADVGPSGVFPRATRNTGMTSEMPSLEQQAMVNLLGVKGGAKKWFAQSTSSIARDMTPSDYHNAIMSEIDDVLPKLQKTIGNMGLSQEEQPYYQAMIARLEAGKNVDWSKFQGIHSAVPGFATGKISGPGNGTSDSILARVSNGEAIIPAKQAKRYAGLVNGMIAGNVPGFKAGKFGDMSAYESIFPGISEIASRSQTTDNELVKVLKRLADTTYEVSGKGGAKSSNTGVNAAHGNPRIDMNPEQAKQLGQQMFDAGATGTVAQGLLRAKGKVSAYSNLTFPVPRGANLGDVSGNDFSKWVSQDPSRFMSMIAKNAKMDPTDPGFKEFSSRVAKALAAAGSAAISESHFESIVAQSLEQQSEGAAKQALIKARDTYQTFNVPNSSFTKSRREASNTGMGMDPTGAFVQNTGTSSYKRIQQWMSTKSVQLWSKYGEEANVFTKDVITKMITGVKDSVITGVKKAAKIASPSKEGDAVGQNIGGSIITGTKKKIKDATVVGEQLAAAEVAGMRNGIAASAGSRYIPGMFATDFDGNGGILQGPRQGTRLEKFKSKFGSIMRNRINMPSMNAAASIKGAAGGGFGISNGVAALGGKIGNMGRSGGMAGMGASMGLGMLSSVLPGEAGAIAGTAANATGMLSMLSMFPQFSGVLGGAVTALAPFAPAILGVTAGVGLLAYGIGEYTKSQNKAASELEGIANVANYTKDELKLLGDYFKYVPTNQDRTYSGTSLADNKMAPSKYNEAQDYFMSDAFNKLYMTETNGSGSLTRLDQISKSKDKTSAFARITNSILASGGTTENAQTTINALQMGLSSMYGQKSTKFDASKYGINTAVGKSNYNSILEKQITGSSKRMSEDPNLVNLEKSRIFQQNRLDAAKEKLRTAPFNSQERKDAKFELGSATNALKMIRQSQTTGKDNYGFVAGKQAQNASKFGGAAIRDAMTTAVDQFNNGTINAKSFNSQMDAIGANLKKIKSSNAIAMLATQISALPTNTQKVINKVGTLSDKLLLIKASMLGLDALTPKQTADMVAGESPNATKAQKAARQAVIDKINKFITDAEAITTKDLAELKPKNPPLTAEEIRAKKQTRLNAAMSLLGKQEDAINKKYDERLKKLDKIQSANEKIADQQKGQLNLADALSRGDISAAAGVVADIRSKNAQDSLDSQTQAINAARDKELAGATVTVGGKKYTKKDLQEMLNSLDYTDTMSALGSGSFAGYGKRGFANGGLVSYFANGGYSRGTDIIPAMLTPGEFVVKKSAVDRIGLSKLTGINSGTSTGESVYNYSINVNVRSESNPEQIAQAVLNQIRRVDNQRVRGNRL